ncbi:TPA: RNA 2'-phosphotransferase [Morganella morganii]|uniref:RNA 2'-phosphotransferase n=1 Tax=Morganella morganii TaxID=582 RepID=UPI001C41E52D|nr:RNA 2'-phosphotransferase [Morganella morganii]ELA9088887.1 RNA 2'-phosphotransferase [Morganella morganii]ELA9089629.1 RNA 2'-phosphotransferase [Morganella morganii]MCU6377412.1 RNA 2'-phosphotransferase [Morganella morganii]HBH7053444.1 RNA 2'-phosphotransferase [Morganella morganii]HBH7054448.1 RNA 2'-phosphotransferase [Morganella morganii]
MNQYDKISKFLSYVLRHQPASIGIRLDNEGWTDIAVLLHQAAAHGTPFDRETLEKVVETNDKKRFTISSDGMYIRAAQGHSAGQVAIDYPPQTPPDSLYHGTAIRFISDICELGLIAGSRHYVHLSADEDTALAVGARHGKPVVLTIAAGEMHKTGYPFYLADNGVWLTPHVPIKYLSQKKPG